MVTYLSDDWVAALDRALVGSTPDTAAAGPDAVRRAAAAPATAEGRDQEPVTVQYRVSGGPAGERAWFLELGPSGVRAHPGCAERPAVTFSQTWEVAVSVARGDRAAQQAVLAGDIRISGDPARLAGWTVAVQRAQEQVGELARHTRFGPAAELASHAPAAVDHARTSVDAGCEG